MALNPFQQGQEFATFQRARNTENAIGALRLEGIKSLGDEFGPTALAPAERATVTSSNRAQERLEDDQQVADQKRLISAASGAVNFFKEGLARNVPIEDLVTRFAPIAGELGFSPEDLATLPQQLVDNPDFISDMEATLKGMRDQLDRKAIGRPIPVTAPDGSNRQLLQQFSDGNFEIIPDLVADQNLAIRRADISQQNVNVASGRLAVQQEKIDPEAANRLVGAVKAGELTATRVDEGLTEARKAVLGVENIERIIELLDDGIKVGAAATVRQVGAKYFAQFLGIPDDEVSTTDEFIGRVGILVASQIQAFGAGTGLSDADREFAAGIVGGDISMTPQAIRRLVGMQLKIAKRTISNYNRDRDAFVEGSPGLQSAFPHLTDPSDEDRVLVYNPNTGRLE